MTVMMGKNLSVFCVILCTLFALSSNVSCTPELIADILATPIREIRASFTPESKPGLSPDIFRETATGMRSFLEDMKQVIGAVDEGIKDTLRENDRQNLVGFRESLEMAYKKTEDLYNRFQSVFEESKLEPAATREDKPKPATSILAAKQNIANVILQLKDEAVRNVNDSLMLGVKKSSSTSPNEEEDTEIKRDVLNNDAGEIKAADSNKNEVDSVIPSGSAFEFLTNPLTFGVFSEWSDAMKNLMQKRWSNISGFTDALYREKSELLNPKGLLVNPNEGVDGLNVLSILRNVTEPITKFSVHSGSADWGEKKNRRNLFRTTRTSSSTKDSNDSVEVNSVLPTNSIKKAAEQAVTTSRDFLSRASATTQGSPLESTLQSLSQTLKKILPDAAVPK